MKDLKSKQRTVRQQSLCEALATLTSPSQFADFLQDLCTPAELEALADRWEVVDPILDQVPYRKIHDQTGVSVTTIGRVARVIEHGHGSYRRAHEKLSTSFDTNTKPAKL